MRQPPLDPDAADEAPVADVLTAYDQEHLVTYLRLLDAEADDADWREVARAVTHSIAGNGKRSNDGQRI
jgi:hypothetical protein